MEYQDWAWRQKCKDNREKPVCNECEYYEFLELEHTRFVRRLFGNKEVIDYRNIEECKNEKAWICEVDPIERTFVKDCHRINRSNDCKFFKKKGEKI